MPAPTPTKPTKTPITKTTSVTAPSAQEATQLTLPTPILSRLSPATHLFHSLTTPPYTRPATYPPRLPYDHRRPILHNPNLARTVGSSVLRLGDTSLTVGVTHSILPAASIPDPPSDKLSEEEKIARLGLVTPHVEFVAGCSPGHVSGAGMGGGKGAEEAGASSARLLRLLVVSRLVRLEDLTIRRGGSSNAFGASEHDEEAMDTSQQDELDESHKGEGIIGYHCLTINMQVLSLSGTHSVFAASWGALYSALSTTLLPKSWWDSDVPSPISASLPGQGLGGVVSCPLLDEAKRLELRGRPVVCCWGVFSPGDGVRGMVVTGSTSDEAAEDGKVEENENVIKTTKGERSWTLLDPDDFEEQLCQERVTMVVDCSESNGDPSKTKILSFEKIGGTMIVREQMKVLVKQASEVWGIWDAVLG